MKRTLILLALMAVIACQSSSGRESKNCPEISDISEALKLAGGVHSKITDIKEVASHRTINSYLHIFSGMIGKEVCVLIFNNEEQYLGCYNVGEGWIGGYISRHRLIGLQTPNDDTPIRLGNRGPWKKILAENPFSAIRPPAEGRALVFNSTQHYIAPIIETETRSWTYGKEKKSISAKLVDIDDEIVFLQNTDSDIVYFISDDYLSNDDRKYIKSIKFEEYH